MVKELDLFESNHGCGLNAPSHAKHPKTAVTQRYTVQKLSGVAAECLFHGEFEKALQAVGAAKRNAAQDARELGSNGCRRDIRLWLFLAMVFHPEARLTRS